MEEKMKGKWIVKIAGMEDLNRWLTFVKKVTHDFYDIDLPNDENYKQAVIKNIKRETAIYVEDNDIIGGMIYSSNQNHITWLAVDPDYRRRGIGSALVEYMFKKLPDRKEYKVKTFTENDWQSKTSHPFYKSLGFISTVTNYDDMVNNENHPTLVFVKTNDEQ
jgi:ribosomal protein S18 acetylase RimI-like enzyme